MTTLAQRVYLLIYRAWLEMVVQNRRQFFGVWWDSITIGIYFTAVGAILAEVSQRDIQVFLPHLGLGLMAWSLFGASISRAPRLFLRYRAELMLTNARVVDLAGLDLTSALLRFFHMSPIVAIILIVFDRFLSASVLGFLLGLVVVSANIFWISIVLGFLGARYRDVGEGMASITRVAFIATPIIWMPNTGQARSRLMSAYLQMNPFYHGVECLRAPLYSGTIPWQSVGIMSVIAVIGVGLCYLVTKRYRPKVNLWL